MIMRINTDSVFVATSTLLAISCARVALAAHASCGCMVSVVVGERGGGTDDIESKK